MKKVKTLLTKTKALGKWIKETFLKPLPSPVTKRRRMFLITTLFIGLVFNTTAQAPFITTWQTSSPNETITFNTSGAFTYSFTVDWGDGSLDNTVYTSPGDVTHTYANAGTYTVSISGQFPMLFWTTTNTSRDRLMTIEQWGDNQWRSISFTNCTNLTYNATDTPDLSQLTSTAGMFAGCTSFNGDIGNWDMSNIEGTGGMFSGATSFNQDISQWDVSNVTDMQYMFYQASSFNQDISSWDVSKVEQMHFMFRDASSFNQSLNAWDVGSVTNMTQMFVSAVAFNQPLDQWDVSNVTNMSSLFFGTPFNQDISNWNVSSVTNMTTMFAGATAFNQDISNWDVSNVTSMNQTFFFASAFDQSLGNWDISNVTNMTNMLHNTNLSTKNYDYTLKGWASQASVPTNLSLGSSGLNYCNAETARNELINTHGWTITGDQRVCRLFATTWQTTTPNESITVPTTGSGYNYSVNWGDGSLGPDLTYTGSASHSYSTPGTYTVLISGDFPRVYFNNAGDKDKIQSIEQWGDIEWESMEAAFAGCINLTYNAFDAPNLDNTTSLDGMFKDASSFNGDLSNWNTTTITSMVEVFQGAESFNGDVTTWNVGNVQSFTGTFDAATVFEQDISNWDMSSAVELNNMFRKTEAFNSAIGSWDVSNVTTMDGMFASATEFDQDISSWNVSNATSISNLFAGATSFNQDISNWDISNVTNAEFAFAGAISFNSDLSSWNMANTLTTQGMFQNSAFNHDLADWTIGSITNMSNMFDGSALSLENYDATLTGWAGQNVISQGVTLGAQGLLYCASASDRNSLISNHSWTILGDAITNCSMIGLLDSKQNAIVNGQTQTIDFGNVGFDENLDVEFTILNMGDGPLTITNIDVTGEGFSVLKDVASVDSNEEATFTIRLNSRMVGITSGQVTITSDDSDNPMFQFPISGEVNEQLISLIKLVDEDDNEIANKQSSAIDFGSVLTGENLDQTFEITNEGQVPLNITSIEISNEAFSVVSPELTTVGVNATETLTIRLTSLTAGVFEANVSIKSDASNSPTFDFPIQGQVTEPNILGFEGNPEISVYPNPVRDFLIISIPELVGKAINVQVHSTSGVELLNINIESTSSSNIIPLKDISSGTLLITVVSDGYRTTRRVIKNYR